MYEQLQSLLAQTVDATGNHSRATPRKKLVMLGDSLTNGMGTATLSSLLGGQWTVVNAGLDSETSSEIRARAEGVSLAYPIRGTDSPSAGTVTLRARDAQPPKLVDGTASAYWQDFRTNRVPGVRAVEFYNRGKYLGRATRRQMLAVGAATGDAFTLYPAVSVPIQRLTNSTNETSVQGGSPARGTLTRSTEQAKTGVASAKFTETEGGVGSRHIDWNGGIVADRVYELSLWMYVPTGNVKPWSVAWTGGTVLWSSIPTLVKGTWQQYRALFVVDSGALIRATLYGGAVTTGAESVYVDDYTITEKYALTAHGLSDTEVVWLQPHADATAPTGISSYRGHYVRDTATNTVKLALTSGGSAVDVTANGTCLLNADYRLDWTATADDVADFDISVRAVTDWSDCVVVMWPGANNPSQPTTIIEDVRRIVGTLRSANARFLILSPLTHSTTYKGSANWSNIQYVREQLAALYPDNYIDILGHLQGRSDGSSSDTQDVAQGVHPTSQRADGDTIHLSTAAYASCAGEVFEPMQARGWVGYSSTAGLHGG